MNKFALRKLMYLLVVVITILTLIGLWVLSASNMDEKIPSRGVFVYSKEY